MYLTIPILRGMDGADTNEFDAGSRDVACRVSTGKPRKTIKPGNDIAHNRHGITNFITMDGLWFQPHKRIYI